MGRYRLNLLLLVLIAVTLTLAWAVGRDVSRPNYQPLVEGGMAHSPAYDSFDANPNFPDGLTLRSPVANTIARGQLPLPYKPSPEDALRAGVELRNPFTDRDAHRLQRGAAVFANYCQVCHGPLGMGDGPVTQGGFPPPPSLLATRAARMPEGQMFHILTYGQGNMPAIAPQLPREDRWSVILHVRQLQRYQVPSGESVPLTLPTVAALFRQNCSVCHGEDGTGSAIRKALPNIPDFTNLAWQVAQTEMAIVNQIDYGSLPLMPAFRYKLTREEIQGLAIYVRSLAGRKTDGPAVPVVAHVSPVMVYQTYCFACHDTTGKGNPLIRKSMPELPDFTAAAWQKSRTDKDLSHSVLEGKGKFMLPMKDKLGPVNASQMVALVRGFAGGKQVIPLAAPKPPGPPPPEVLTGPVVAPTPRPTETPTLKVQDEQPRLVAPSGELAARIRVGAGLFRQFCIVCHGPDGTGNLMRGSMPPIPNFTNRAFQRDHNDAQLLVSILEGKGALMPANSGRITRDQARDLVAYIRAFGPPMPGKAAGGMTDTEFAKRFRLLQQQWDELEKEMHKLKGKP